MRIQDSIEHSEHCCDTMTWHLQNAEVAVVYYSKFREYGVRMLDGGSSYIVIAFCPWCGTRLPSSMRDAWFDELETLDLEPESPELPNAYRSDSWSGRAKGDTLDFGKMLPLLSAPLR